MTRRFFLILFCVIAAGAQASAQSKTTVVILVRHAEKATAPAADPPLTEAGVARARALADALGLPLETVHTGTGGVHARAVADAVRAHAGQTVLVVGHSNTIPLIIAALGGPKFGDICDTQYSNLFVLIVRPGDKKADLVVSSYGAPSPDAATTCPGSMK